MENITMENITVTVSAGIFIPQSDNLTLMARLIVTFQIVMMLIIVSGNMLVLLAVMLFHILQDVTGKFVANLAIADLVMGLSLPFQVTFFFYPSMQFDKILCLLRFEVVIFVVNVSLFSLLWTVLDRYVAIVHPFMYPHLMKDYTAYILIAVAWVYCALISFLPSFGINNWGMGPFCLYGLVMDKNFRLAMALQLVVFSSVMFIVYLRIAFISRKHLKRIHSEQTNERARNSLNFRNATKMINILAIVVLMFSVAWLPFSIIQIIQYQTFRPELEYVGSFLVFLGIANSAVNPFIYAWKNRDYRYAFKKLLCCSFRGHSSTFETEESHVP